MLLGFAPLSAGTDPPPYHKLEMKIPTVRAGRRKVERKKWVSDHSEDIVLFKRSLAHQSSNRDKSIEYFEDVFLSMACSSRLSEIGRQTLLVSWYCCSQELILRLQRCLEKTLKKWSSSAFWSTIEAARGFICVNPRELSQRLRPLLHEKRFWEVVCSPSLDFKMLCFLLRIARLGLIAIR